MPPRYKVVSQTHPRSCCSLSWEPTSLESPRLRIQTPERYNFGTPRTVPPDLKGFKLYRAFAVIE